MKKEYIRKDVWSKMLNFFMQCEGIYLGNSIKLKSFIESIYLLSQTGAQWREMPKKYGKWNSIYSPFKAKIIVF